MKMSIKFFLIASIVCLSAFSKFAKADSITLNVTSWSYGSSILADVTSFTINANDSTGKIVTVKYTLPLIGGIQSGNFSANISGLPYTATTTAIVASNSFPVNGTVTFALTAPGGIPASGTGSVALSSTIFTGSIISGSQTLSFSLTGIGLASYPTFIGGLLNGISASGTGGTLSIDPPLAPVPEPATLLLLSSGIAALGLKARTRKKSISTNQ